MFDVGPSWSEAVMMNMRKRLIVQGMALSLGLVSVSRMGSAQAVSGVAPVQPDLAATAQDSSEKAEPPSAPDPNIEIGQSGGAGQSPAGSQTPPTGQNPPAGQNPQDQSKPATAPSLGDLGFTPEQTQPNAQMQAMLNKRTQMLKVHQTLGLITTIPMVASLITGPQAKAKGKKGETITEPTTANLDFHLALGGLTSGLYWTTAYYSIFAPKIPGVKPKGAIRLHRALEWVHGPGMIITPLLGIMAYKQENSGEKTHGLASYHGTAAYVTTAAYGASIVAVSWPIHWKFWESKK
jgi:hypothetical protein